MATPSTKMDEYVFAGGSATLNIHIALTIRGDVDDFLYTVYKVGAKVEVVDDRPSILRRSVSLSQNGMEEVRKRMNGWRDEGWGTPLTRLDTLG